MDKLNSLTPTLVLIVGSLINHIYRDNKVLELRDFMLILSPTIPTILPILISFLVEMFKTLTIFDITFVTYVVDMLNNIKFISYFIKLCNNSNISDKSNMSGNDSNNFQLDNIFRLNINGNVMFIQSLISYIQKNTDTCQFNVKQTDRLIKIENNIITEESEIWENITIKYNDIIINVSDLELKFTKNLNNIFLIDFLISNESDDPTEDISKFTRFSDFIGLFPELKNELTILSDDLSKTIQIKPTNASYERELLNLIKKNCPNINEQNFMMDFYIFDILTKNLFSGNWYDRIFVNYAIKHEKINLLGHLLNYEKDHLINLKSKTYNNTFEVVENKLKNHKKHSIISDLLMKEDLSIISKGRKNLSNHFSMLLSSGNKEKNKETQNRTICLTIENTLKKKSGEELNRMCKEFIEELNRTKIFIPINTKIKIYSIKIKKTQNIVNSPNPEFEEYENEKNKIMSLEKTDQTNLIIMNFMQKPVPPKELKNQTLISQIVKSQINEKFKSLDTLYLRKNDIDNLLTKLNNFKNNKEIYEQYCLPNKLGILLQGVPGTGKTTTINAIASYLQKPIYYVNFSTIETNEDLQMIFDEVLTGSSIGGIIVFEDIDSMTEIVHKRELTEHKTNGKLTLEYFLNLLQGSLTRDNTVFIVTTNHADILDDAFKRIGRFDIIIDMKKCDHYQIETIYKKFVGRKIDPNVLKQIKEDEYIPAEFIFHLIDYLNSDLKSEQIMSKFMNKIRIVS